MRDVYYGPLSPRAAAIMREAIAALEREGATIVRANIPTKGWIGGPGTADAILNRNPASPARNPPARPPLLLLFSLQHDLQPYPRHWLPCPPLASAPHHY